MVIKPGYVKKVSLDGHPMYNGVTVADSAGAAFCSGYMYYHVDDTTIQVQEGDTVATGQRIGKVGQSGRVTGPHLHWTVRFSGSPVDGASLLTLPPFERLFDR